MARSLQEKFCSYCVPRPRWTFCTWGHTAYTMITYHKRITITASICLFNFPMRSGECFKYVKFRERIQWQIVIWKIVNFVSPSVIIMVFVPSTEWIIYFYLNIQKCIISDETLQWLKLMTKYCFREIHGEHFHTIVNWNVLISCYI